MWRETVQSQWLEPGKSRNKVSVDEPADGLPL
uniref:Transposase n=1 Tax=Angiostrongylus cantonensis TaxID=6313 RepID=A0A0K0CTW7_ANGCA